MAAERIDIGIIGGGAVGCAVAWELADQKREIFLFEKNPGIGRGENQSSRNSGVIHSGLYYDRDTRALKAEFCVEGNRLLYEFCDRFQVPALRTGKLVVANSAEEEGVLDLYLDRAKENGVPWVTRISGEAVRELEPNVTARSALLLPTAGIIEPVSLVYRLHTLAGQKGVQFLTGTEVMGVEREGESFLLTFRYPDGKLDQVRAGVVVNAAGIHADRVSRLLDPEMVYEFDPVKGESYSFYANKRPELALKGMNVYPTPTTVETPSGRHFTVGIHLTPTFASTSHPPHLGTTVTVGPKLVPATGRADLSGPSFPPETFVEKVKTFFPGLTPADLVWHQSGLQARLKGHPDFIVAPDRSHPGFVHLLGIDSPGLTSCLAIARKVKRMVEG